MIIVTSREFRNHQKKYFDLVDKKKQVVIKRRNKSYQLKPITEDDRFFSDNQVVTQIEAGIRDVENGDTIEVKKEDFAKLLGL